MSFSYVYIYIIYIYIYIYTHATKRFIDGLGTLNDAGVFNDVCKVIFPH